MLNPTDDLIIKKVTEGLQKDPEEDDVVRDLQPHTILGAVQGEVARALGLSLDRVQRAWNAREEGVPSSAPN